MTDDRLERRACAHLERLCADVPGRATGSEGNHLATEYVAGVLSGAGFDVTRSRFAVMHWTGDGVRVTRLAPRMQAPQLALPS